MHSTTQNHPTAAFWDKIAAKYAKKPIADMPAYEEKLARLRALLRPQDRLLEIGCGTGSTALRMAPHVAHVTATDVSRGMIDIARSKLGPEAPANVDFLQAEASASVDGQPFDAICAFSLLHLVDDLPQVLAQVRSQLKPGGLFLSKTACLRDRIILLRGVVAVMRVFGLAPPVLALSRAQLVEHLQKAGFEIEDTVYFGTDRMSPFIVARKAL